VKYIQKRNTFDGIPCDPQQTRKLQEHLAARPPKSATNIATKLLIASFGLSLAGLATYTQLFQGKDRMPVKTDIKHEDLIDMASVKK